MQNSDYGAKIAVIIGKYGTFEHFNSLGMILRLFLLMIGVSVTYTASSQRGTLYDDTRVSSVSISLPPDSLQMIYDSIFSDHYFRARFIFDDLEGKDTLEDVGFRLRGNLSRYSQKKSFKISFNEYVPGRKYQGVKKLNLNGEHNDPTLIREKLFYDLWKRAGFPERRTSFVRLYINGSYYGLYTNLEEMDKEWLKQVYTEPDGNLFKCTYPADLTYHGPQEQTYKDLQNGTVTGGRVYDLQTNQEEDDYSRLVQLITILNKPATGTFAQEVATILDVDIALKALALDVATGNWDDYSYNKNNYYLYDDPARPGFEFITYDPDNTFGVDWYGIDWGKRDYRHWINPSMSLPLTQKLLAVPSFFERYTAYIDTITRRVIDPAVVFPRIDSLKSLIFQAAIEDTWRTRDYGYSIADFEDSYTQPIDSHTPYGLKPFFTTRRQSLLDQMKSAGIDPPAIHAFAVALFPNPAHERITLVREDPRKEKATVTVYDLYGLDRMSVEWIGNRIDLPVGELEPGCYLVRYSCQSYSGETRIIRY
ncbi:MAG TPA: CotH kinase family protein [Bacteroidales bacterium]|nr:CotH kinase family protein [Bacteroidales bacterium]